MRTYEMMQEERKELCGKINSDETREMYLPMIEALEEEMRQINEAEKQAELAKWEEEKEQVKVAEMNKKNNKLIMKALKCKDVEKAELIIAKTGLDVEVIGTDWSVQGYVELKDNVNNRRVVISKGYDNKTYMYLIGSAAAPVVFANMGKVDLVGFLTADESHQSFLKDREWAERENIKVKNFKSNVRFRKENERKAKAKAYVIEQTMLLLEKVENDESSTWDFKYEMKSVHDKAWDIENGYEVK